MLVSVIKSCHKQLKDKRTGTHTSLYWKVVDNKNTF